MAVLFGRLRICFANITGGIKTEAQGLPQARLCHGLRREAQSFNMLEVRQSIGGAQRSFPAQRAAAKQHRSLLFLL